MADRLELTEELRQGTRALEGVAGLSWDGELEWRDDPGGWSLRCGLQLDVPAGSKVPPVTSWWVLIASTYPAGWLEFLPAKDGGLEDTFPHQIRNEVGSEKVPWRQGKLCLRTDVGPLRRFGDEDEPFTAAERLVWNVRRARHWLELAARGELLPEADPYELPDFRSSERAVLAFAEDEASLEVWRGTAARSGYARLRRIGEGGTGRLVVGFEDEKGGPVGPTPAWGPWVEGREEAPHAVWLRFDAPPKLDPWKAPMTWRELRQAARAQGVGLEATVARLARRLRSDRLAREKRPRHPLLIGFPIPARMGGSSVQMYWIGFELPRLAAGTEGADGFRKDGERGLWEQDRRRLHGLKKLPWLVSESWSDEDLTGRGALPATLRESRVLLIGAGALGSAVGELLVRGGVRRLVVVDDDRLAAGNLVRHGLTLEEVGAEKAAALARRLAAVSPHADVSGVGAAFAKGTDVERASMREVDVVVDTTASNEVLVELERFDWGGERTFVSLSVGPYARRLYAFVARGATFPRQEYVWAVTPSLEEDWAGVDVEEFPRGGTGCWDPLFPARGSAVTLLAAAAVEGLACEGGLEVVAGAPRLEVYERVEEEGRFGGVRRRLPGAVDDR